MAHYEEASKRLITWINSDLGRQADFKKLYPGTVQEYLNHFAYKHNAIPDLIRAILVIENERVVDKIMKL
jgi:hypothetical protein